MHGRRRDSNCARQHAGYGHRSPRSLGRIPPRRRRPLYRRRARHAQCRRRRIRRHRGADRLWQIHAAQHRRRADRAVVRPRRYLRQPAGRAQPSGRLSVPGRRAVSLEDGTGKRRHRAGNGRHAVGGSARAGAKLAHAGGLERVRRPLSAHALGRPAQAGRAGAGADPRSENPADGRAVRPARRADPADHGQPAARPVERRPQGGAVRHPRSGRGDRAQRPRGHHVGGAGGARHRRLAGEAGAAARHRRDQARPCLPRIAPRHLAHAQGRGDQGLRADGGGVMSRTRLIVLQVLVAVVSIALWHVLTTYRIFGAVLLPPFFFSNPLDVAQQIVAWFASGVIWKHLWVTLIESILAFVLGSIGGVLVGFWFARQPRTAAVFDPYVKMVNALPRVVLAPIFTLWLGLGIWSKVALGVTLVFFIVFFNVYQGVKEVSPTVLANARMLGMSERQLMRHVYWPSALSWMFSSLHTSVGFAVVGAGVGEYLGSAAGLGYLIQQAEGVFDVAGGFAGMFVLSAFVILIDLAVTKVERRLLVWRPDAVEGHN